MVAELELHNARSPSSKKGRQQVQAEFDAADTRERDTARRQRREQDVPFVYTNEILNAKTNEELVVTLRRSFGLMDLPTIYTFLYSRRHLIQHILKLQKGH